MEKMNFFKGLLRFIPNKYVRKYLGGYWECWSFKTYENDRKRKKKSYWLMVSYNNANDIRWIPPHKWTDFAQLETVEYYPYNFFGDKKDFTEEVKLQHRREQKIERILNENRKR